MRRKDCGGRASAAAEEAGDIDARHAAFPDGKDRQVAWSSPASWGRCCGAVAFTAGQPAKDGPSSQRVRQRGGVGSGKRYIYTHAPSEVCW